MNVASVTAHSTSKRMRVDLLLVFVNPVYEPCPDSPDVFTCDLEVKAEVEDLDKGDEVLVVLGTVEFPCKENWTDVQSPE